MPFDLCRSLIENVSRVIVGKGPTIELLVVALLAEGHVLIEDLPGLGKTLIAKTLARSIGATFKRIQFTPDLLPADVTGFNVYNQQSGQFTFQPGPVLTHVLLADEINRTIPRTQASLLESMEERQVTVDGKTYPLPRPFLVLATQNPIEMEGTFPLPEAQLDRFLLRMRIGYPERTRRSRSSSGSRSATRCTSCSPSRRLKTWPRCRRPGERFTSPARSASTSPPSFAPRGRTPRCVSAPAPAARWP